MASPFKPKKHLRLNQYTHLEFSTSNVRDRAQLEETPKKLFLKYGPYFSTLTKNVLTQSCSND